MSYVPDGRFTVVSDDKVHDFLSRLVDISTVVACDTETEYKPETGGVIRYIKGTPNNHPFCVTMSDGEKGWYINVNPVTIPALRKFFECGKVTTVWFNQKYDMHMLANIGINVHRNSYDVMSIHHLIQEEDVDADGKRLMDLKGCAVKYIDKDAAKFEKFVLEARQAIAKETGRDLKEVGYEEVPTDLMVDYACADTLYTKNLFDLWMPMIKEQGLERVLNSEMRCLFAVWETERNGMLVNQDRLPVLKQELQDNIERITKEIYALAGKEFNINSSNELVEVFTALGVDYHFKTDKDEWQTDVAAMEYFTRHSDERVAKLAKYVLEFRGEDKLLNTFIANIEEYLQEDGRVHPEFWLTGARTGRMSSSNPNF
jgi:DNA polymerase-1